MNRYSQICEIIYGDIINVRRSSVFSKLYMLQITNMVAMRNSEILFGKFNVVGIYTSGNYAQKTITKLFNY